MAMGPPACVACSTLAKGEVAPDAVVFLDADGSDEGQRSGPPAGRLGPGADLVIGSRTLGSVELARCSPPSAPGMPSPRR